MESKAVVSFEEFLSKQQERFSAPVIITKDDWSQKEEWIYSESFFDSYYKYPYYTAKKSKATRTKRLKELLLMYHEGKLSISIVHLGIVHIYGQSFHMDLYSEEFTEKGIGKRGFDIYRRIPGFRVVSNDEFIAYQWQQMISENGAGSRNPRLSNIRLMFNPELFEQYTGVYYTDSNLKWVEPLSGRYDLECRLWVSDTEIKIKRD
ncbi:MULTISPECIES: hypothetical protein [Bacillota]|uniref:hypothetical protein n=1 Tax=Bacillota TaxID=1239 RepID=UPI0039F0677F